MEVESQVRYELSYYHEPIHVSSHKVLKLKPGAWQALVVLTFDIQFRNAIVVL